MSTKKIYFILLVLIVILIFTSAAICGNCTNAAAVSSTEASTGSGQNTSSSVSSGGSPTTSEQGSSSTHAGNPSSTSQAATTSTSSSEEGSPTISLAIYEGPNYSPADDIYYFRIEATVTGSPKPVITWSKDDSSSAWGNKKAQINLNPGQTYTLIATAKNSVGIASANIVLTAPAAASSSSSSSSSSSTSIAVNHAPDVADINVPGTLYTDTVYAVSAAASDADGDTLAYAWSSTGGLWTDPNINPAQWRTPAAAGNYTLTLTVNDGHSGITVRTKDVTVVPLSLINLSVPAVYSEGGYIENGGITNAGGCVFAGDTGANKYARGYMSYNITSLAGTTIDTATFTFILKQVYGNPTEHAGSTMSLQIVDYGGSPISQASLLLTGIPIYNAAAPIFSFSGPALKTQLQNAINAGKQRFQLCVAFTAPNFDSDGVWDGWEYDQTGITLNIKYLPAH
ncbi:MAG: hypothetical protein WCJ54_07660 [Actinomycetota bacterium]